MAICRRLFFIFGLVLLLTGQATGQQHQPLPTGQSALTDFVLARHGTEAMLQKASQATDSGMCIATSSHLLAIQGTPVPAPGFTPQVEQAQFRITTLRAKHALYECLTGKVRSPNLRDPAAAKQTYVTEASADNPRYTLQGIEFFTAKYNKTLMAVVTIPLTPAQTAVELTYEQPFFQQDYCRLLYPEALRRYGRADYANALTVLKEAHDLNWGNAEAYVLLAKTFLHMGQKEDAQKIAVEILESLTHQLTSALAEELGEIFLALAMEAEAQRAFETASTLLQHIQ